MATDPIHQFKIEKLVDFGTVNLPVFGQTDLAFTNSHLAMTIAFAIVVGFLSLVTAKMQVVPGRLQAVGENLFGLIDDLAESIIGHDGRKYFPFIFTIFTFILAMNLLGLMLTFTVTSQLAITAAFGLMTILLVIIVGFVKHGLGFFKLFIPSGVPWVLLR
jgi:F-type H+-transporting ATPase subunit a